MKLLMNFISALCMGFFCMVATASDDVTLVGTWKGVAHGAIMGIDTHHEGKTMDQIKHVKTPFTTVIEKQEGRSFSGYHFSSHRRENMIGALRVDMKSGIAVDSDGIMLIDVIDKTHFELCYAHAPENSKQGSGVAACVEYTRQ